MKNSKTTKRALFSSVMSLLLCVSMLIGTTFAWFTDTASTGVNKIVAGNLDVSFMMKDEHDSNKNGNSDEWLSVKGESLPFMQKTGDDSVSWISGDKLLWEPGARFDIPALKIENNGNLALKFKLIVNGVTGDVDLAEVIDVYSTTTVNGEEITEKIGTLRELMNDPDGAAHGNLQKGQSTGEYKLSFEMQKSAGNDYANQSISDISFTVLATQDTVEHDSFGNNYDETAGLEEVISDGIALDKQGNYAIYNAAGMIEYREMMDNKGDFKNKTVYLLDDIDMTGYKWDTISWAHYDDGYKLGGMVFDGKGHKVSNLFINGAGLFDGLIANGTVTFKNVTFDNVESPATSAADQFKGVFVGDLYNDVIFEKVTVSNTNIGGYWGIGAFVGRAGSESSVDIKIKDSHVTNFEITAPWNYYTSSFVGRVNDYNNGNDTITFNGANTITNFTVKVSDLDANYTGGSIHTDVSKHPNVTVKDYKVTK